MIEWIEILLRSGGLFFLALFLLRVMGKRQPSRMNPFNFVNYMVIAIISALISLNVIRDIALGLTALGVWVILSIAMDYLALKSKWVQDLVNGKATILMKDGKVMEENLLQVRYTGEELLRDLRSKNVFNLADVEFAVMETTGDINVLLKSEKKPVTPHDLGKQVSPQPEPQTVILDGNILNEPLSNLGLNRDWLKVQLNSLGVSQDNVFIGQVDGSGELYVDLFDDAIQIPQPKVKELLFANLDKTHADLLSFALDTKDDRAKEMYLKNAKKLKHLMEKLEPFLLR
ncbi:DUF421 domain-containing protein [Phosphitispora fastidiosa]|uniref:DUF421 domain-containing protein n=1 Tax=Phosphitispora fastidiosa TaxID=2837202 RepID=UPI001E338574|nr:DUF421 domain-containing protein [Phosphitispora fastidiosa]MBU7006926.1 uncharacterized membrane protein YcaP (DUF421 family) [Phosphitispora fastidiosa]